jgi:hypothetical protein
MTENGISEQAHKKATRSYEKPKAIKAFKGIVLGVFNDDGPKLKYNLSEIPDEIAIQMVVHGMSAVHGGENMLGGLFGPLPVHGLPAYRFLIYSFKTKATNTKDKRILEHGRIASIFLILKKEQQRYVLNNFLTIEKKMIQYRQENWERELDMTKDSIIVILKSINEIIHVAGVRVFSYGKAGLIEFSDPQLILKEGIISIISVKENLIYMYLPTGKFDAKERINAVEKMEEINIKEYGNSLNIKKIRDYLEFKKILTKHSIHLVK